MTDHIGTPADDTPADAPASPFTAVAVADLPAATTGATPESIALGKALLAIVNDTTAARDGVLSDDRKSALNRGSVIKRAVSAAGGAPKGKRVSLRIIAEDGGYRVNALLVPAKSK